MIHTETGKTVEKVLQRNDLALEARRIKQNISLKIAHIIFREINNITESELASIIFNEIEHLEVK